MTELRAAGLGNFNLDLMYALPATGRRPRRSPISRLRSRSSPRIFRTTSSRSSRARCSRAVRRRCRTRTRASRCRRSARRAWPRPGTCSTRSPRMHGRARSAATTATTGSSATTWALAPARTASSRSDGRVTRTARHRSPARYMAAATPAERIAEERVIEPRELPFEFCLNALRLVDGFDIENVRSAYRRYPDPRIESGCAAARERGLLEQKGERWVPTRAGTSLSERSPGALSAGARAGAGPASGRKIPPEWLHLLRQTVAAAAAKSVMAPKQLYTPAVADPKYATLRVVIQVTS